MTKTTSRQFRPLGRASTVTRGLLPFGIPEVSGYRAQNGISND